MNFEWDESKSEACFVRRGFDFAYAVHVFLDDDRLVREDTRFGYDETRMQVIGQISGRVFVVVYTPRREAIRIISARKANQREVRLYENRTHEA